MGAVTKPEFMSLSRPHPIWTTCGNNYYEVSKAVIQARFLSGRYRCETLTSHFTTGKTSLQCSICPEKSTGSVEHILLFCSALKDIRTLLLLNLQNVNKRSPFVAHSFIPTLKCSTL